MEEVDKPPPDCPRCNAYDFQHQMKQEFKPPGIIGSHRYRAQKIAEDIAEKDYGVADMKSRGEGEAMKVRYKDQTVPNPSTWGLPAEALRQSGGLQGVLAQGKNIRQQYGSSLDVIKTMPDLIEASKNRMRAGGGRIW
jgi:hypothetical protein